jgi:hypothetical protein
MNINVDQTKDGKGFEVRASIFPKTLTQNEFTNMHLHAEHASVFRDIKHYDTYALSRSSSNDDDTATWNVAVSYPVTSPLSWIPWKTTMRVNKQIDEKNGIVHFQGSSNCVRADGRWSFVHTDDDDGKGTTTVQLHQKIVFHLPMYVPGFLLKGVVISQTQRVLEDIMARYCPDHSNE